MFRFASVFSIFCALFLNIQAELDISFLDIDVPYYHPGYFENIEVYLLDDNKLFGNFTIINYLPDNIMWHTSIVGATMGEFKVPTGFDSLLPMCEIYKDPIISVPVLKALNFQEDVCPPSPGTYVTEGFEVDLNLFPDTFPGNNYVVKTELYNEEEQFIKINTYQRIV